MALVNFEDLPSTNTPINASNLNGNFKEVGVKIGASVDNNFKTNIIKGKNLFNKDNFDSIQVYFSTSNTSLTSNSESLTAYFPCFPNTTYTISKTKGRRFYAGYTTEKPTVGTTVYGAVGAIDRVTPITITTGNDAKYLVLYMWQGGGENVSYSTVVNSIQIEFGSDSTTYESYITPKIYAEKNEIYSEEKLQKYSPTEQKIGTWIDGLPLYRKIISDVVPTTSANGTDVTSAIFVADNIKESIIEWAYIQVGDVDIRKRQIPFITTSGYRIIVTSNTSSTGTGYNTPNYVGVSNNYASYSGKAIVLSVLYTKTTD